MTDPLGWIRERIGSSLRDRVAGPDAADHAERIWDAPGERWFSQEDPIWRVHADASMFVGGIRALLLQSLHPLAMAGVAAHSGYKGDPWGRLQRTSHFLATTTFGTITEAEKMISRIRRIHNAVRGTAPDGRPYAANDPALLEWVHITEIDSFLGSHQRFAKDRLTPDEADGYVAQTAIVARHLGVLNPPLSVAQLTARIADRRPELAGTDEAREAAKFLLLTPPLPLAARAGYTALAGAAVALLPGWARRPLRLPHLPVTERLLNLPVGNAATSVIRWAMTAA